MKTRSALWTMLRLLVVLLIAIVVLFPVYIMVITSFKTSSQAFDMPPEFLPAPALFNYHAVLTELNFTRYLYNSLVISLVTTAVSILVCIMSGYALARFNFRGAGLLSMGTVLIRMVPPVVVAVPMYVLWTKFGLTGGFSGLVLAYLGLTIPLNVWMLSIFIKEIPFELEEAAAIDGCSYMRILWGIVVPLIKPGISVTSVFTFRTAWNEFLLAIILSNRSTRTLPAAVSLMISDLGINWGQIMAMATIIAIPAFIVTFACSKNLITGMTAGAVKG
ncbi:carbohydrate ABC transporter permease [Hungatella effluvii]|uniref:carbohydrate ABC transporter permease n=1 Tax=Hungatella effluvii TaxID=1096246 RepID=UPI0022E5D854|nr:carbohydrate ABC transporter permease [Hungatella effluvii]